MRRLVVAPRAERDIDGILARSEMLFGGGAAERYRLLINRAIANLLADPDRPGVLTASGLPPSIRLYPLRLASSGVAPIDRVSRPRHLLVFRYNEVELRIARVLHDRMDVAGQLIGG